ncbi:hypothetical protein [Nannocystis pusilla]|uniref:hypothetical protein n=1 Tax=Nannocystis pusilla TaxID=889268 RepID=UPI003B78FB2C
MRIQLAVRYMPVASIEPFGTGGVQREFADAVAAAAHVPVLGRVQEARSTAPRPDLVDFGLCLGVV